MAACLYDNNILALYLILTQNFTIWILPVPLLLLLYIVRLELNVALTHQIWSYRDSETKKNVQSANSLGEMSD